MTFKLSTDPNFVAKVARVPIAARLSYAGDGVPMVSDCLTGERRTAQIFVAVLGASNFAYAQATWTQGPADWISAHVGVSRQSAVCRRSWCLTNTKVAVIKASLHDPQINRTYAEMAAHYGTAVLPARPSSQCSTMRTARSTLACHDQMILANDLDRRSPPALRGRRADPACQHPRTALLQLGDHPLLTLRLSSASTRSACMAWLRPSSISKPPARPIASATPNDSRCCSNVKPRCATTSGSQPACAVPSCASKRASRTSTTAQRSRSRDVCQPHRGSPDRRPRQPLDLRPVGVGKSWLASALGHKACRDNRFVLCQRVARLFDDLALARGVGRHPRLLRALGRVDLLILDGVDGLTSTAS
nr:ATP-binding protein [Bradyrhizobium niftali]